MKNMPPRWVERILEAILKERFADETIGDLHEWFSWKQTELSKYSLYGKYLKTVLLALCPYKIKQLRFIFLIGIGFLIGIPFAIYFCSDWLAQFSYRIQIGWGTVVLSGVVVLIIGGLTIGINTLKAALANPVIYLRNE